VLEEIRFFEKQKNLENLLLIEYTLPLENKIVQYPCGRSG
jgi:hypothetical protein